MEGFSESSAAGTHRATAVVVAASLGLGAGYAAAFARAPLPHVAAFVPIVGSLAAAGGGLTAYLLATQARATRSLPLALLAFAYACSSCCTAAIVLAFPGVLDDTGYPAAFAQLGVWFWLLSHGAFAALVVASTFVTVRFAGRPFEMRLAHVAAALATIAGAAAALAWLVIERGEALPVLATNGRYAALVTGGAGPAVLAVSGVALVTLILGTRLRTVTQLWLAVALWASFLDLGLTIESGARFTLGWYVGRLENVATSTIVLVAILGTVSVLFEDFARRARIDALTGLANRRSFEDSLVTAIAVGGRTDRPTSLVVLDVDHFKVYNDRYGHVAGDAALRAIAAAMRSSLKRRSDVVARYGGDAFAAILPATPAADARRLAEEIRTTIERLAITHAGVPGGTLTVSVGLGTIALGRSRAAVEGSGFVTIVDRALALAKERGRNAVACADDAVAASAASAASAA